MMERGKRKVYIWGTAEGYIGQYLPSLYSGQPPDKRYLSTDSYKYYLA